MRLRISADNPCLPGHFPGRPLVPGVVILERVLQAVEQAHGPLRSVGLPQVKFMQPLLPGQTAEVVLEGAPPRWRFRVLRGDQLLASGEITGEPGADAA